jgi:hypothetical protein
MIDPVTGSLIMQGVGQLAGGLFRPRRSKTLPMQEAYARSKMGYIPYFDNMMKQGQQQQNTFMPVAQKSAMMGIEAANKPLTQTDVFKGTGAANAILQNQGDAAAESAGLSATRSGLSGPAAMAMRQAPVNSLNAAQAGNIANFAANYEAQAPQRLFNASQVASGMAGAGTNMMTGGIQGATNLYSQGMQDQANIGAQYQAADDAARAEHAQFTSFLTGLPFQMENARNTRAYINKMK